MSANAMTPASMRSRGFTLIELLIVVLVVAILAAIAVPSYRQYVLRTTRTDAKTQITSIAQQLERCFTRDNAYDGPTCAALRAGLPITTPDATYTVGAAIAANTYLITATPINGQLDDTQCANFTLNQVGVQNVTGTKPANECW